ncbi:LysR family transcriptional regulator [Burkholderia plantarii]|uniref:LysR family transcriptional regulator n=1 Tax=Burkholderia plantarii TaxID=41899 RepID=UPI0007060823|nr:LysR family transcriptional regulator [Burkholderia plantarii]ALK30229.1 LysR family transcriptional regulator [Burkholderia plantarii]GLZ18337.1 LysR family transcriptional regulator [Burkholderia plantarii]
MMIDELKSFIAVVDETSLTRAADLLCVSQSTISKRIQRLEEVLGATLFDRNAKPPRPTALASRVYEQAVPVLRALNQLQDIAREDSPPSGTLRFGLPQAVADIVLFDAVTTMKARFPALDVRLLTDWSVGLQRMVENGSLDAALLMLPAGASLSGEFGSSLVTSFDVKVVQSAGRPVVDAHATVEALSAHGWILNPDGCGYRAALERAMANRGQRFRLSIDTYGTDMQLRLVASGLGLGLVPTDVLHASPWRSQLSIVEVSDFSLALDVWLVFPRYPGNFRRAVDVLAESVAASFQQPTRADAGADLA